MANKAKDLMEISTALFHHVIENGEIKQSKISINYLSCLFYIGKQAYSEPFQISKMVIFAKIVNDIQPMTIFCKNILTGF